MRSGTGIPAYGPYFLTTRADQLNVRRVRMTRRLFAAVLLATAAAANAGECSPRNSEAFAPFFQRFSTEKTFAMKRTVLPLRMLKWEYGFNDQGEDESAPVWSVVSAREYLQWPTLADYMKSNNLTSNIDSQARKSTVLKVFKQDTDWQMLFHFKLQKGCWHFWQFENQSL